MKNSLMMTGKALADTIEALSTTIELRDSYTACHQKRVARLACAIARESNVSEDKVAEINVIGLPA